MKEFLFLKDLNLKGLNIQQISELYFKISELNPPTEESYENVRKFLAKKYELLKELNEMYCYLRNNLGPFSLREEETVFGKKIIEYYHDLEGVEKSFVRENVLDEFKVSSYIRELKERYENEIRELKERYEDEIRELKEREETL